MQTREFTPAIYGRYEVLKVDDSYASVVFNAPAQGYRQHQSAVIAYHLTHEEARRLARSMQRNLTANRRKFCR